LALALVNGPTQARYNVLLGIATKVQNEVADAVGIVIGSVPYLGFSKQVQAFFDTNHRFIVQPAPKFSQKQLEKGLINHY
jgi:hypothetical protein